ncbi:MAG: toast rack family protein [Anaerolineaceae bacterium]|nr:toast rack family protein [Anaerolineaceae bacterium]
MKRPILIVLIILLITSVACSFTANLPKFSIPNINVKTGPTETFTINEALPTASDVETVDIAMGAGTLGLDSGATGLVDGTVRYNIAGWKPSVTRNGNQLNIHQERTDNISIPTEAVNDWQLKLSNKVDLDLRVTAGAYKGALNLGGLRLHALSITDGASASAVHFDQANPIIMDKFTYKTGASQVNLYNLANANFTSMTFESGAGNYILDFSGELKQDSNVSIKSGVSQITIIIPKGTAAKITNSGALTNVDTQGTWSTSGSTYETTGGAQQLTIDVTGGVGNLILVQR